MWPFPPPNTAELPSSRQEVRDIIRSDKGSLERTRWTRLLIAAMRGLAVVCLVRGLIEWARILGFIDVEQSFEDGEIAWQLSVVVFAVFNSVAAVGLWMATSWGAVLWLILTLFELALPWVVTGTGVTASPMHFLLGFFVLLYLFLSAMSMSERSQWT
jgi:hypothetical protein